MKIQLLVIVAPFGFGPAAKALILANGLQHVADITFCADRDAFDFIEQYKHPSHGNVRGMFGKLFTNASSLGRFDYFISINHAPALQLLARYGLAQRTIFFDSLFSWRASKAQVAMPPTLLAYFVQDYPGIEPLLSQLDSRPTALTAPMIWPLEGAVAPVRRRGILLHLGGLTSPLASWKAIADTVMGVVTTVAQLAQRHHLPLTVVGSAHLKTLPPIANVDVLGSMSPEANVRLIAQSALLVTTPGIGAVYEAMAHDTPVLLLPPMNSTQLHHYLLLTSRGLAGTIPGQAAQQLAEKARPLDWEQQTLLCLGVLKGQPTLLLAALPGLFARFLAADPPLENQQRLFATFSQVSAVALIEQLISQAQAHKSVVSTGGENAFTATPQMERAGLKQYLQSLPKAELHIHLEGAIRPELLLKLAERNRLKLPFSTPEEFYSRCVFNNFRDFANLLLMAVACLRQLEDFYDAVVDMGRNLAVENVRYAEVTWTPQFYLNRGFHLDNILAAMNQARSLVKKQWGVDIRWLPDLVRSYPKPAAIVAQWLTNPKLQQQGVVAMGLGGPEMGHPAAGFSAAFTRVKMAGLPANPHAGEGMGPESVWETLQALNPSRLGHGVRAVEDAALLAYLAEQAIPLEVCLSSNIKLGLYRDLGEHPLRVLIAAGCRVTLNTDDPVLFQTTLSQEYLHAMGGCGLDLQSLKQIILGTVQASYLQPDEKQGLLQLFRDDFGRLDKIYMDVQ